MPEQRLNFRDKTGSFKIAPYRAEDLPAMHQIEQRVYANAAFPPWSPSDFQSFLTPHAGRKSYHCVAKGHSYTSASGSSSGHSQQNTDRVIGYGMMHEVLGQDKTHRILNLAVDTPFQQKGVGTHLFDSLLEKSLEFGAKTVSLEVDEVNEKSRTFYEGYGFDVSAFPPGHESADQLYMTASAEKIREALSLKNGRAISR